MLSFATEFPVKHGVNDASFVAQVIAWLRGAKYSSVLDNIDSADLEKNTVHIQSAGNEELRLRQLIQEYKHEAIGFRHDFSDILGRLWRTESVLARGASIGGNDDLIRIRTDCIARRADAELEFPRKPYFIKSLLQDGWGGKDGEFVVSDHPIYLADNSAGLSQAVSVATDGATLHLPVVFVSATGTEKWLLSNDQIEKLAYDLGGIAHVVVEPNRAFSFQLRDLTEGANAYGGTIGVALPGRGIVRRFYIGLRLQDAHELLMAVREAVGGIRSHMPAVGWDWTELQERALRRQRERDRKRLSSEEAEKLYQEEIANLQDRVSQLEGQLAARPPEAVADIGDDLLPASLLKKIGPEIYPGEYFDRLRLAAKECVALADQIGLDVRSRVVFDGILIHLPTSPALSELRDELRRATKDPKRLASEMTSLLQRHGYREKSDNKHIRMVPKDEYLGLETITLAKTPSEGRGLQNTRKQIERTLGLTKLS
jgi:hypothetical protein